MTKRNLLFSFLLLLLATSAFAQFNETVEIDFEDHREFISSYYTGAKDQTEGLATFRGGQLIRAATNQQINLTTVYATGGPVNSQNYCHSCVPVINLDFAEKVSNISFDLVNWTGVSVTFQYGINTTREVTVPARTIRRIEVGGTAVQSAFVAAKNAGGGVAWNFAIDNIKFEAPVPEQLYISIGYDHDPNDPNLEKFFAIPNAPYTAYTAIGRTMFVKLWRLNSNRTFSPVAADYSLGLATLKPDLRSEATLFRDKVLLPLTMGQPYQGYYFGIHLGETTINLYPRGGNLPQIAINMVVVKGKLGTANNGYDNLILDNANKRGIPPQILKGQVRRESSFIPTSYRYEPLSTDLLEVSGGSANRRNNAPFWNYRMASRPSATPTTADARDGALSIGTYLCPQSTRTPACIFTHIDDLGVRTRLHKLRGGVRSRLEPNEDFVTAEEIFHGSDQVEHWSSYVPRGRAVGRAGPNLTFTGQTSLAASYGLLQTIHVTAIAQIGFIGPSLRQNPTLLFDTDENLRIEMGSINFGPIYLLYQWPAALAGGSDESFTDEAALFEVFRRALNYYNHQNPHGRYATEVLDFATNYRPEAPSHPLDLSLCSAPQITGHSSGLTATPGTPTHLYVQTNQGDKVAYQWYAGAPGNTTQPIDGATRSWLVVPASSQNYWVSASNACGSATSSSLGVQLVGGCSSPELRIVPVPTTITEGEEATLSVSALGSNLNYQWYVGNSPVETGATPGDSVPVPSSNTAILKVRPTSTTTYWAMVSNGCGQVYSTDAIVTVKPPCVPPSITQQPQSTTVTNGQSATLSVAAAGTGPFTYQWFANGTLLSGATAASVTVTPTENTSYSVTVTGACGNVTSGTATISVCNPPQITAQPQDATIQPGANATIGVSASGTAPLTFALLDAGGNILQSNPSGSFAVAPAATTTYTVRVSNACGSTTSNSVTINLCAAPVITQQPQPRSIVSGDTTTLSVQATGIGPLTYQWFANGSPVGGNSSTLTVSPVTTTSYHVVVSNDCNTATSATATVTVSANCDAPVITTQPQSATITAGQAITLAVTATGNAPLSYQWFANGSPAGTNATLTVSPTTTTGYHVVVTNACGSTTSATATITVGACNVPSITAQPQSVTVGGGQAATVRVTATGNAPLSYQWFANGSPVAGATMDAYTVAPTATTSYHVVVTNPCGTTTSSTATVTVSCLPPVMSMQPQSTAIEPGQAVTLVITASGQQPFSFQWYANGSPVPGQTSSALTVSPTATTTYYIVVSNVCGSTTSNTATVSVQTCLPARITTAPQNRTIATGESTVLSVQTSGTQPRSYQWTNAAGAVIGTGTSVTVSPSATTTYTIRVSNACGSDSHDVTVTVQSCPLPTITVHPPSFEMWEGGSPIIEVVATSSSTLSYQWFANGVLMPGKTSRAIEVEPTTTTSYTVKLTNACGTVTSNPGTITVKPCTKPQFTSHPQSATIREGENATISGQASGTLPMTYTLIDDDRNFIDSNSTGTFSVRPPVMAGMTWGYTIIASNGCGTVFSDSAVITVCAPPVITSSPQSVSVIAGQSATLSVSASGSNLTYQWFTGSTPVGTGTALTVAPTTTTSYYVRVSNACGQVTSATATVNVTQPCTPPSIISPTSNTFVLLRYGLTKTLTASVSGTNLQYQWFRAPLGGSFAPVPGANSTTLAVSPDEDTDYFVRVTNTCGSADTARFNVHMWDGIGDPPKPEDPV